MSKNTIALCDTLFDLIMQIKSNDNDETHAKLIDAAQAILPLAAQYTDIKRAENERYNAVNKRCEILSRVAPDEAIKVITVKAIEHG